MKLAFKSCLGGRVAFVFHCSPERSGAELALKGHHQQHKEVDLGSQERQAENSLYSVTT